MDLFVGYLSTQQLASLRDSKGENERKPASWKSQSFYNLMSEAMTHHFYCIRIKSLGLAHPQREKITQGPEYQEVGSLGAILEAAYHTHQEASLLVIHQILFLLVESCPKEVFLGLVLKVLLPGKHLSPRKTRTVAHPNTNKVFWQVTVESRNNDMLISDEML